MRRPLEILSNITELVPRQWIVVGALGWGAVALALQVSEPEPVTVIKNDIYCQDMVGAHIVLGPSPEVEPSAVIIRHRGNQFASGYEELTLSCGEDGMTPMEQLDPANEAPGVHELEVTLADQPDNPFQPDFDYDIAGPYDVALRYIGYIRSGTLDGREIPIVYED